MENSAERPPVKDWAVLVYVAADVTQQGMHRAAIRDLEHMAGAGSNERVYVAAQYHSRDAFTRRYVFPRRPSGQDVWDVKPVESFANVNSADPKTIENFFDWGLRVCPATNTMLVLWGHGFGLDDYTPQGVGKAIRRMRTNQVKPPESPELAGALAAPLGTIKLPPGTEGAVIVDAGSHQIMTNRQVGEAVRNCQEMARKHHGNLAILGFDSCVMGMAEVWCELAGGPQIGIASQTSLPYKSWPYHLFLPRLLARPQSDPRTVAGMLVDSFADFYRNLNYYVTLSACDLGQLDKLKQAMAPLARALRSATSKTDARQAIFSARNSSPSYDPDGFIDLDCFCGLLQLDLPDDPIFDDCRRVREEIRKFIFASTYAPEDPTRVISLSKGVSIWFPPWIENPSIREDQKAQSEAFLANGYGDTQFGSFTKWGEFLQAMVHHRGGANGKPDAGETTGLTKI